MRARAIGRDLPGAVVASLVCGAVCVLVKIVAVRAVFAVPLCLLLPGYALTSALIGRPRVSEARELMLVPALSLTTLVLGALLLDAVPGGLRIASWTALLVVVVVVGSAVAAARAPRLDPTAMPEPAPDGPRAIPFRARPTDVLLLLLAALVAAGALVASRLPLPAKNAIGYSQLWMLTTGSPRAPGVKIGVASAEQHPTTYRLTLTSGAGRPTVIKSALTLRPGASTVINIPLVTVAPHARTLVVAQLYENGGATPSREVTALISPPTPATTRAVIGRGGGGGRGGHGHGKRHGRK